MQATEAHFQLKMQMILGMREEENYENDTRMSKHNNGSRIGCLMDLASLVTMLTSDLAKRVEDSLACTFRSVT